MILPFLRSKKVDKKSLGEKSKLICGNNITRDGGPFWTAPELVFEGKKLIPTLQQLLTGGIGLASKPVVTICNNEKTILFD